MNNYQQHPPISSSACQFMRFATRATDYTQLSGKHPFMLTIAAPTRLVVHLPVHAVCKQVGGRHPQRPRDGQAQLPEAAAAGGERFFF